MPSPGGATPARDAVHVWRARLDVEPRRLAALQAVLAPEELERAERFVLERDRRRFVAARGMLRELLARYVGGRPESVAFAYGAYGKPALAEAPDPDLQFNVTHSGELALYAFALGRRVGVDAEEIRTDTPSEDLARRFFSSPEVAALDSLAPSARRRGFFTCWVRKEAYLKALGEGLSVPLDGFSVSLRDGDPPALLETRYASAERDRWTLVELRPRRGYVAAVALEGAGRVERYTYQPAG